MEIIGIICEYNPFHNGHLYHLNYIKEKYPDSLIILVLGGNFLERGDISLMSKWNKVSLALNFKVDLVIDLPTLYNTNSADIFAESSVGILHKLGVTKIVFGSETADIKHLTMLAKREKDEDFNQKVKYYLEQGLNYPTSLSKSLNEEIKPNDILAISYIKAILKIDSHIEPIAIQRTSDYNDTSSISNVISANNIREKLAKKQDIKNFIPNYDINLLNSIDEKKLFLLLKSKIITDDHLDLYLGVDEGLDNRLKKVILEATDYQSLIKKSSSKRFTVARIKRTLMHILIGIYKEDINCVNEYIHVLGFNDLGQAYLKSLDNKFITTKPTGRVWDIEKKATLIYFELTNDESVLKEFSNKPIIKI